MALALTASVMVGCGTKKGSDSVTESTTTAKAAEPTTTTKAAEPEKPLKFSMVMSDSMNKYALQSPDISNDKWILEINKRCNVEMNLKLLDHKRFQEQLQMIIASGDIPDVTYIFGDWKSPALGGAVENGAYWALDDLVEKDKDKLTNLMNAIPEQAWSEAKTADGQCYSIPLACASVGVANGAFIRSDLLQKYNLEVPSTLDEWVHVMKVFKENGMKYPYLGREKWS